MPDERHMPRIFAMSYYLKTGRRLSQFQARDYKYCGLSDEYDIKLYDDKARPGWPMAKTSGIIYDNAERMKLFGGRYVIITVRNMNPYLAPLRMTLGSYPLDDNGKRITAWTQDRKFGGHMPPIFERTFEFDAGPVGVFYKHILEITPDTGATDGNFMVRITLEARY